MTRTVGFAGATYLFLYIVASFVAGQRIVWLGDVARIVPPIAFAVVALQLARRCRGQVRIFWHLNALHGLIWAGGQMVRGSFAITPGLSPADPILLASLVPLATAFYSRPDRDRPRWITEFALLDFTLIALFGGFAYAYFTIGAAGGPDTIAGVNRGPFFSAIYLLLASWASFIAVTSAELAWRKVLGIYALGLVILFVGALAVERAGAVGPVGLWQLVWMLPYVVMAIAAAVAFDAHLLAPGEDAPAGARPAALSIVAILLLVAIPVIEEIGRRIFPAPPSNEALRIRLALLTLVPFGVAVVVREIMFRRLVRKAREELAAAQDQLEQKEKLAAVGQLLSGVAHELNNPLQGVLGYAELLLSGKHTAIENEEIRAILDNANRAAGIVRNLLAFAGRTVSSARGWQQINRIVRDAAAGCDSQLQASHITLRMELADRLPLIYVDQGRLKDVLVTLIQNANGTEIVVSTTWQTGPDRIVVEVADNGSGLAAEELARIFDPLFGAKSPRQGVGRGLSMCHDIIQEHGGTIAASNVDAGGSAFTVELPVMAESLTSESLASGREPHLTVALETRPAAAPFAVIPVADDDLDRTSRRRSALVVDDEESNAALVRRVLVGAGYEVDSTTLSRRALVMIERTAYDVVICDVKMPELSGQELYGRTCQIRREMAQRFIFITGDIDGQDTRDFLDRSRCSYFMKPFNLERLTAAVDLITGSKAPDTIG